MESVADSYKKHLSVCPLCFGNLVSKDDPPTAEPDVDWGMTHIACPNCFQFYLIMAFNRARGLSWYTTDVVMNNCQMRDTMFKKKLHSLILEYSGKDLAEKIGAILTLI
jgi:hypothetical protein